MSALVPHDDHGLEAARAYAFQLGATISDEHVRYLVEVFLEAHGARIERNRISSETVETRLVSPWQANAG